MKNDRQKVEAIFHAAKELAGADERESYLRETCQGDPQLKAKVEALLKSADEAEAVFGADTSPNSHRERTLADHPVTEGPGTLIGRYKLLQKLGEGGFGVVYLAEQKEPVKRRVALKIIKLGMDTRQVVARFEAERQALAMMDHPNIARVLDAGATETGRPFFVMELVRGIPITKYCDENQLTTQERLDLFMAVCQAVQHAHQKGIIHRDLKPSNILVTLHDGVPVPKVIDFGIAKATQAELTEKTVFTQFQQMIGTPAYMSPEQAEMSGLDIDTRTDIYSLGVLLYELLTGKTPLEEKELLAGGYDEIRRRIKEQEPMKPSTRARTLQGEERTTVAKQRKMDPSRLGAELKGDLDWIVMKALEKDRTRRYETANGMAMDIERHLTNEPVVARPPSSAYRLQKLVRRNRLAFAAAGAVVISLVAGISVSTWQAFKAREAQRIATRQRDMARWQRDENRRLLYAADMIAAQQAWNVANLGGTVELLRRYEPRAGEEDLRGFAWYYLWRLCQRGLNTPTLEGHTGYVWSVAFSPDGRTLATASADTSVKLWDVATRKEQHTLTGHDWVVLAVSFSPDGKTLASASPERPGHPGTGTVKLWNPNTGELRKTLEGTGFVIGMAISGRGKLATGTMDGKVTLWDMASGKQQILCEGEGVRSLAFSPDGNTLAFGSANGTVWLRDLESDEAWTRLLGHTSWVRSVAFSPDGKTLASASHDHTVKLWEVMTGKEKFTLKGHEDRLWSVAFSPDGKTLASAGNMVKLWDVSTGRERDTLIGHNQPVYAVAFSRDGMLASGSHDTMVKLWDLTAPGGRNTLYGHTRPVWDVDVSREGKRLASCGEDGTVKLWDVTTGEELRTLEGHANWVTSVAFSPDDGTLASAGDDGTVKLWDLETGKERDVRIQGHESPVFDLAFSPKGGILASAGNDATIKLWDVATGKRLDTLDEHASIVWAVAFSPDGKTLASGSDDRTVKVWNLKDGSQRPMTLRGHGSVVNSVAFSPDGKTLASGSADDTMKLWDLATGHELRTIAGHSGQVWTVAFSPDGKTLASGGQDTTIKLWNADDEGEPETLIGHSATVMSLVFTPDGNTLISGSSDSTVKLWRRATRGVTFASNTWK